METVVARCCQCCCEQANVAVQSGSFWQGVLFGGLIVAMFAILVGILIAQE